MDPRVKSMKDRILVLKKRKEHSMILYKADKILEKWHWLQSEVDHLKRFIVAITERGARDIVATEAKIDRLEKAAVLHELYYDIIAVSGLGRKAKFKKPAKAPEKTLEEKAEIVRAEQVKNAAIEKGAHALKMAEMHLVGLETQLHEEKAKGADFRDNAFVSSLEEVIETLKGKIEGMRAD